MSLLLHVCCGPCLLYPADVLEHDQVPFTCYFFNPNIHPYKEFRKRLRTFLELSDSRGYQKIVDQTYGLKHFLRSVVFREEKRCSTCYLLRLKKTFEIAKNFGFSSVTSTLLYSKYQQHDNLLSIGKNLSEIYSLNFFYKDFRIGWEKGIIASKELGLYRQAYCGCIYSEQQRYEKKI